MSRVEGMLFAAEGGGFFCSSASGYSKGLAILLLGQMYEDPLRDHSIFRHYNLTDQHHQKSHPDLQLASRKDWLVRKCASFVCFGGGRAAAAAGLERSSSPVKVVPPTQQQGHIDDDELFNSKDDDDDASRIKILKSSLKKLSTTISFSSEKLQDDIHISHQTAECKRKVQWTDTCGGELAEIQEFELSESGGSDGEFNHGNEQRCLCRLM
ncbi:uncharacterized protein LOC124932741 [Impatiens glandulifera]|uniref:uncharacterized protein LOC124932741 n=1 Tax=Impatiens glandulifera TaxID=253017 RepID=UPI001FB054F8|nr:uncharacterized protein LOC124932741 [Impatiens glandulifera]XP_047329376.1 uncharacterized protein LOC124932741 [Impatiens glandulifera]